MSKFLAILSLFFIGASAAQDVNYARMSLEKLSSKSFYGRGYVKKGDKKAAAYLSNQFKKDGLKSFGKDYFQSYNFAVNTFPGKVSMSINGRELVAGEEFVISSSAPAINGQYNIAIVPAEIKSEDSLLIYLNTLEIGSMAILTHENFKKLYGKTVKNVEVIGMLTDNTPFWHVSNSGKVDSTTWFKIKKEAFIENAESISVYAENKFISNYQTQNVVAFVEGKLFPEQFVIFSAHYDHLGMMGNKTFYPGSNDNASGTAMLLDLARYYSLVENQPDRSIAFIAFSGEEAGLYGSKYFVENPLLPFEKIQLVINLDMVGTGSDGITVVNGELYPDVMKAFKEINLQNNYLSEIKSRGESCNSDHCPFYQKGIKSIFIYTRGNEHTAYHTPDDNDTDFPFTAYSGLFKLLTDFVKQL